MTDSEALTDRVRKMIDGAEPEGFVEVHIDFLSEVLSALGTAPAEPVAWVVLLKYGPDRWSDEMLTDVLPSDADTYKIVRALYPSPAPATAAEIRADKWEHDFAEYEGVTAKELAETVARYGKALNEIASLTQTERLLWWQIKAREALGLSLSEATANG